MCIKREKKKISIVTLIAAGKPQKIVEKKREKGRETSDPPPYAQTHAFFFPIEKEKGTRTRRKIQCCCVREVFDIRSCTKDTEKKRKSLVI